MRDGRIGSRGPLAAAVGQCPDAPPADAGRRRAGTNNVPSGPPCADADMHLIDELESLLAKEESMFRAQLLREDVARLRKLVDLAGEHEDFDAFVKAGTYIGWTKGDMRTHELKEELGELLRAVYGYARGERNDDEDQDVRAAWDEFHVTRLRKLVHCL